MVNFRHTTEFPLMPTSMQWEKKIHPNLYNFEVKGPFGHWRLEFEIYLLFGI